MKELVLHCPPVIIDLLNDAIQIYAQAAYPPGGSECAQSAREALLVTAQKLLQDFNSDSGTSKMSRRIRSHVKAALEYYFEIHPGYSTQQQLLVSRVLAGETVTLEQWQV